MVRAHCELARLLGCEVSQRLLLPHGVRLGIVGFIEAESTVQLNKDHRELTSVVAVNKKVARAKRAVHHSPAMQNVQRSSESERDLQEVAKILERIRRQ